MAQFWRNPWSEGVAATHCFELQLQSHRIAPQVTATLKSFFFGCYDGRRFETTVHGSGMKMIGNQQRSWGIREWSSNQTREHRSWSDIAGTCRDSGVGAVR